MVERHPIRRWQIATDFGRGLKKQCCLRPLSGLSGGGGRQRNERNFMMNDASGWMNGWSGGGMWLWTVIGVAVVILLVVVIGKLSKK